MNAKSRTRHPTVRPCSHFARFVDLRRRARRRRPREALRPLPARRAQAVGVAERGGDRAGDRGGVAGVEADGGVAGDLAQHRQVRAGDRHAARHRLEHRQAEALEARRGDHERRGGVERLEPVRVDGAEQPHVVEHAALGRPRAQRAGVGPVAREREHRARVGGDEREAVDQRGEVLVREVGGDAERERPRALADVGGRAAASAGGGVTPFGTTATRPAGSRSSRAMSAAEACETVITRSARRAAAVTSTFVPSRIAVGTVSGSRRQRTSWTVSTRARPAAAQRPEVRDRVQDVEPARGARQPPQLAQRPRRRARRRRSRPRPRAPPRSRSPARRRRLAVDERGQLEVGPLRRQPAHQLARVGLAPARLARDEEQQVEADPHGSALRTSRQ